MVVSATEKGNGSTCEHKKCGRVPWRQSIYGKTWVLSGTSSGHQEEGGACQANGIAHGGIPRIKGRPWKDRAE